MLIRPMNDDDVPAVEQVTGTAFYHVDVATRPANWPDPEPRSPQRAELWKTRMHHLLKHDSPGCWVAEDRAGAVVGCAAALLREGMFGLSVLAVLPDLQAQGIGRQLLDAALSYAPSGPGFICSSQDAKAIRRYRLAGFDIHPAMLMWGHVRRAAIPALPHVRAGGPADVDLLDDVDRASRGHAHGVDHELLLTQYSLRVVEHGRSRGYAYLYAGGAPYLLAANDVSAAREALWAALAESDPQTPVDFGDLTPANSWAIDAGFAAGLDLYNEGYLAMRAMAPPPAYLPSGHFL